MVRCVKAGIPLLICLFLILSFSGCAQPPGQAADPVFTPHGGTFTESMYIAISCQAPDSKIYYTTDGSDPTSSSLVVSDLLHLTETVTIKAQAFKDGFPPSRIVSAAFTRTGANTVAKPVFDPPEGSFTDPIGVSISCVTGDATIHYTLNGSVPTSANGTLYTAPITLTQTTTIKAIACKSGMTDSPVATATYDAAEGILVVHTDIEESLIAFVERNGLVFAVYGRKNENGGVLDLTSTTFRMSPDSESGRIIFDEQGLVKHLITQGWIFHFSNWRGSRADCMIVDPQRNTVFIQDVVVDPQYLATLQALGSASSPRAIGWALKTAATAIDGINCKNAVRIADATEANHPEAKTVIDRIVSTIDGCASIGFFVDLTGNETVQDMTTAKGFTSCTFNNYAPCGATGAQVLAETLVNTHNQHENTQNAFNEIAGLLRGVVRDAADRSPLSGAQVKVVRQLQVISRGLTDANGHYAIILPAGTDYQLEISKNDYLPVTYFDAQIAAQRTSDLETFLQIHTLHDGDGHISGKVTNAFDGNPVAGATINFRRGINARQGDIVFSATTDATGAYQVNNAQAEIYTGQVTAPGFMTGYFTVAVLGGTTLNEQNIGLSPQLAAGEVRIVLTWGNSPRDLDAHLTGPRADETRFHIHFNNKGSDSAEPYAALDHDEKYSHGPETVTIYARRSGIYRYIVHDYTNRSSNDSMALANSEAEVKIYGDTGLMATFSVPAEKGTAWVVFELDGDTGQIDPVNTMHHASSIAN